MCGQFIEIVQREKCDEPVDCTTKRGITNDDCTTHRYREIDHLLRAQPLPWLAIAALMLTVRLVFVFAYPIAIGDASVYQEVARNILYNGCVSLSPSTGGLCAPHWGGNQLPGYPAFVAAVWSIFGETNTAVRVIQAFISSAALVYLAWAGSLWTNSRTVGLILGTVLALSPATLGWPRHMFTESLAIACSAWVFAELIRSLAEKNLRFVSLGLALAVAVFIRLDLLSLCVPVALIGLVIERPGKAIAKGAAIIVMLALPLSAWMARSVTVGLPAMPNLTITANGERFPAGFMAWGQSWATDQYQLGIWMYPVMKQRYRKIAPPPIAFDDEQEARRVGNLLDYLATIEGQVMPVDIDAAFGEIAMERAARAPIRHWLVLPLERALAMWANPASSTGLPLTEEILGPDDIKDAARRVKMLSLEGLPELVNLMARYPELLLYKAYSFSERMIVGLGIIGLLFYFILRPNSWAVLPCAAASFAVTRTMAFAYHGVPSTRYTVEAVPALEAAIIIAMLMLWKNRGATPR